MFGGILKCKVRLEQENWLGKKGLMETGNCKTKKKHSLSKELNTESQENSKLTLKETQN